MNTPIEVIEELHYKYGKGTYRNPFSIEYFTDGFRSAETYQQELINEFIESFEFPRTMAIALFAEFEQWRKDNGK